MDIDKMDKNLDNLKFLLRESEYPFFSDSDLQVILDNSDTLDEAAYFALGVKAENSEMEMSGYKSQDTRPYFLDLKQQHWDPESRLL